MRSATPKASPANRLHLAPIGLILVPVFILLLASPAWALSISGTVKSGLDVSGVAGVMVEVAGKVNGQPVLFGSAVTSSSGAYTVSGLSANPFPYSVATAGAGALGYQDATPTSVTLLTQDATGVNFILGGARVLTGIGPGPRGVLPL